MLDLFCLFFTFYNFRGVFPAQLNFYGVFFAKIISGLKLLIVFANGFGFDVSMGYEFTFEFALSQ